MHKAKPVAWKWNPWLAVDHRGRRTYVDVDSSSQQLVFLLQKVFISQFSIVCQAWLLMLSHLVVGFACCHYSVLHSIDIEHQRLGQAVGAMWESALASVF